MRGSGIMNQDPEVNSALSELKLEFRLKFQLKGNLNIPRKFKLVDSAQSAKAV